MDEIVNRRSIRSYSNKEVSSDTVKLIVESARLAPSGSNTQPWNFIIVRSDEIRSQIAKADHHQSWMLQAPVFIVCVADIRVRIKDDIPLSLQEDTPMEELKQIIRDTAIAAEHIVLSAENLGLSTCWTAWFTQNDIRPILNIPDDKYVVCVLTVGYADENPKPRPRKNLESILHFEKW